MWHGIYLHGCCTNDSGNGQKATLKTVHNWNVSCKKCVHLVLTAGTFKTHQKHNIYLAQNQYNGNSKSLTHAHNTCCIIECMLSIRSANVHESIRMLFSCFHQRTQKPIMIVKHTGISRVLASSDVCVHVCMCPWMISISFIFSIHNKSVQIFNWNQKEHCDSVKLAGFCVVQLRGANVWLSNTFYTHTLSMYWPTGWLAP